MSLKINLINVELYQQSKAIKAGYTPYGTIFFMALDHFVLVFPSRTRMKTMGRLVRVPVIVYIQHGARSLGSMSNTKVEARVEVIFEFGAL